MNPARQEVRKKTRISDKRGLFIALGIAVMGLVARLSGISEWWLNPDEGIYYSMLTWEEAAPFLQEMMGNAHPPLYYLATRVFGFLTTDFVVIRGFSVVLGTAAIFAAWLAGRELASPHGFGNLAGLVAAVLVAVSPGAIVMSQLIRPYMMQLTLVLLAFFFLLHALRNTGRGSFLWYSAFLSLAIGTHYSSVLVMGVFAVVILCQLISSGISRGRLIRLFAAHLPPGLIFVGLYLLHLRPHLIGSALAAEALEGWLGPQMIDSVGDAAHHFLGFAVYWFGPWLAIPATVLWIAGLGLSLRAGSSIALAMNLSAVGIAVIAAAAGLYPFGACRHTAWLVGFFSIAVGCSWAQIWTLLPQLRVVVVAVTVVLALVGQHVARFEGIGGQFFFPAQERVLKRSDVKRIREALTDTAGPEPVLMSLQSYYLLLPFYVEGRSSSDFSTEAPFFSFSWNSHTVVVVRSWNLSTHPDAIGEPNHLYTFAESVDRLMPELRLAEQHQAFVVFGGWASENPGLLLRADQSLPPSDRLITRHVQVPGLTLFVMDIARYRVLMRELIERRGRGL